MVEMKVVSPAAVYRVLKTYADIDCLDEDHISSMSRDVAEKATCDISRLHVNENKTIQVYDLIRLLGNMSHLCKHQLRHEDAIMREIILNEIKPIYEEMMQEIGHEEYKKEQVDNG